jgi:hypothetical protein
MIILTPPMFAKGGISGAFLLVFSYVRSRSFRFATLRLSVKSNKGGEGCILCRCKVVEMDDVVRGR